jgi:hypothetical protein
MIAERSRHIAFAIYANGMGYLEALDAGQMRFPYVAVGCLEIRQANTFERY